MGAESDFEPVRQAVGVGIVVRITQTGIARGP
jgi:hypothetical protein